MLEAMRTFNAGSLKIMAQATSEIAKLGCFGGQTGRAPPLCLLPFG